MAVPKKRTSKSRRNIRKTKWKEKASQSSRKALSTALSLLKRRNKTENIISPSSDQNDGGETQALKE
jgi:large subunit ribosomal protein L32